MILTAFFVDISEMTRQANKKRKKEEEKEGEKMLEYTFSTLFYLG